MSGESKTITVEVKVTVPECCGAAAAAAPSLAAPTEPDIGTGTQVEKASGRVLSKSEIDAGHTGYRLHQIWAEVGGAISSVGFLFITNNAYPGAGAYVANKDYWVWPENSAFPDTFYLAPDALTQNEPTIPDTYALIERSQVPFVVNPTENLPPASSGNYKMWQVSRRNNPFTTSWNPRKIFLQVFNDGSVTWWAKNDMSPGIAEISSANYLKLFGDESLRFTRITTNPADTAGYRKAVT